MASVIPVARALYLCDNILSDPVRVKPHLIGVLNAVRPPSFPHLLRRLCVFAQLTDGLGDIPCRVRIVNAGDLTILFQTAERPITFRDRRDVIYARFRIEQLLRTGPGEFVVELDCGGEVVADTVLTILG